MLLAGVDTLYLGFRGRLPDATRERLKALRGAARPGESPLVDFCGHAWSLEGGDKNYLVRLRNEALGVLKVSHAGMAHADLTWEPPSATIWRLGWRSLWDRLRELSELEFRGRSRGAVVSRIDLAADIDRVAFANAFDESELIQWASRGKPAVFFDESCKVQTFWFGAAGAISLRVYKKTDEVLASRTGHVVYPRWQSRGWEGGDVWRVEVQLRRDWLRGKRWASVETGGALATIDEPGALELALPAIWRYCVGGGGESGWLSWRAARGGVRRSRWPVRAEWRTVQAAAFEARRGGQLWDVPSSASQREQLLRQWRGLTEALARLSGEDELERELELLRREAEALYERDGTSFKQRIRDRLAAVNAAAAGRVLVELD